jgi:hypothetical protein
VAGLEGSEDSCNSDDLLCTKGAFGPLCGACDSGYYYAVTNMECVSCSGGSSLNTIILFCVLGVVLIAFVLIQVGVIQIPDISTNSFIFHFIRYFDAGVLKVVFSTYQIIQGVTYSMDIDYPSPFSDMINGLGFLSFNFAGFDCAGYSAYDKVIIVSAAPLGFGVLIVLFGLIRIVIIKLRKKIENRVKIIGQILSQHVWALLLLSYLVLPPIMMMQFQILDCFEFNSTDKSRVSRVDTSIDCDSRGHKAFEVLDITFICIYLSIPFIWIVMLHRSREHLFPFGVNDEETIVMLRDEDTKIDALRFLFESYRPNMVYWESFEMFRRVLFVGLIPLMSPSTLRRGILGVLFSLISLVVYHELIPFRIPFTNTLAYIAQLVIFLTYAGSHVLETKIAKNMDDFVFGVLLCLVNFVVVVVSLGVSSFRAMDDQKKVKTKREKLVKKIEWACHFSSNKFETTFESLIEASVSSSHCLVYFFGSLVEISHIVKCGISVKKLRAPQSSSDHKVNKSEGIVFSLKYHSHMKADEKLAFESFEAAVVCSLPRRLLFPLSLSTNQELNESCCLRLLPASVLRAMRGSYFGDIANSKPWKNGELLLPPHCILRAYQLEEVKTSDFDEVNPQGASTIHRPSIAITNIYANNNDHLELMPCTSLGSYSENENIINSEDISIQIPVTCTEYCLRMTDIRQACQQVGLVPLYHFTMNSIAPLIIKRGFRMSTQGQGDGGVYFSTLGPASYDLGSEDYEKNIIVDCFGKERLEEYRGKHKLDVCLVYGVDPLIIEQAPGGRDNAKVVSKATFEIFGLPHADGSYFLRPDRLFGAFLLDPAKHINGYDDAKSMLLEEKRNDTDTKHLITDFEKIKGSNAETVHFGRKKEYSVKIQWACGNGTDFFKDHITDYRETSISSTQFLVYYYCSLSDVKRVLQSGIPAQSNIVDQSEGGKKYEGILFTQHLPGELSLEEEAMFSGTQAFVVCSLPRRFLISLKNVTNAADDSRGLLDSMYLLPCSVLRAMRGDDFESLGDHTPWTKGGILLPPRCIRLAYQILEEDDEEFSESNRNISIFKSLVQMESILHDPVILNGGPRHDDFHQPKSINEYVKCMNSFREVCSINHLVPLYYYTSVDKAERIMKDGFSVNIKWKGDDGIHFNTLSPASYDVGSNRYEENIIVNQFGEDHLQEYKGKHMLDVCLVYGVDPLIIEQAPGGRDKAKVVSKATFEIFGLPHADGSYFLRPDRLFGGFLLQPPDHSIFEIDQILLKEEKQKDQNIENILVQCQRSMLDIQQYHNLDSVVNDFTEHKNMAENIMGFQPLRHPVSHIQSLSSGKGSIL